MRRRQPSQADSLPLTEFEVDSVNVRNYNTMRVMSTAVPNLQKISICDLGQGHKYIDGEDPELLRNCQFDLTLTQYRYHSPLQQVAYLGLEH